MPKEHSTISLSGLPILIMAVITIVGIGAVFGLLMYLFSGLENANKEINKPFMEITGNNYSGDIDTSSWREFNSKKDVKIKFNFSFKFPPEWFFVGSLDGGNTSGIPFYKKLPSGEEKVAANFLIAGQTVTPAKIDYDNELREGIIVDNFEGEKITGINMSGQKEMRLILPTVNDARFEFVMSIENEDDEYIFNRIISTLKFMEK